MPTDQPTNSHPKWMFWGGWALTLPPVALLSMSAMMKLMKPPELAEGFTKLGWPDELALALGLVEICCTVLYLIPATAVLGAILLTGYLGGAVATHVRIQEQFIIPMIVGVAIWGALWLRDARLRRLLPIRR